MIYFKGVKHELYLKLFLVNKSVTKAILSEDTASLQLTDWTDYTLSRRGH